MADGQGAEVVFGTVEHTLTGRGEFVQFGDRLFARDHIVAVTNLGKHRVTVHTKAQDFAVDLSLADAAAALDVPDYQESTP